MNLRRRIVGWIIFLFCVSLIAGCWDSKDINKRYLPIIMAVNKKNDGQYHVILHYPLPGGKGLASIEEKAPTISKAIDLMRTNVEKDIDLLHIKLILINKSFAQKGIGDLLDVSMRSREISAKALIAIVHGDFEQMNKTLDASQNTETASFEFFSKQAGWTPNIPIVPLWSAYRAWHSYTEDIAVPVLLIGEKGNLFSFEGSAVMQGDKMISKISLDETVIYNLFRDLYKGGTMEIKKKVSVRIVKSSISNHAEWKQSVPTMRSQINLTALVLEEKGNTISNEELAAIMEEMIRKKSGELSKNLIKEHSDLLGTGKYFRSKMSDSQRKYWKEKWFPKLVHAIKADVTIGNAGYLKNERSDRF
jgi:Ger(x)C family germination protein